MIAVRRIIIINIIIIIRIIVNVVVDNCCIDGACHDACAVEKPQQNGWSNVKLIWLHGETFSNAAG